MTDTEPARIVPHGPTRPPYGSPGPDPWALHVTGCDDCMCCPSDPLGCGQGSACRQADVPTCPCVAG